MATPSTNMPIYPSETRIAIAVLGPERAREWHQIARYLEDKHGFPRIDPIVGARHWESVVVFFRIRHGISFDQTVDGGSWMAAHRDASTSAE